MENSRRAISIVVCLLAFTLSSYGMYVPLVSQDEDHGTSSREILPAWYTMPFVFSEQAPSLTEEEQRLFEGSSEEVLANIGRLLGTGLSVQAVCETGGSLLHWAVSKNMPRVAKLLVDRGAYLYVCNGDGYLPFRFVSSDETWGWLREIIDRDQQMRKTDSCKVGLGFP